MYHKLGNTNPADHNHNMKSDECTLVHKNSPRQSGVCKLVDKNHNDHEHRSGGCTLVYENHADNMSLSDVYMLVHKNHNDYKEESVGNKHVDSHNNKNKSMDRKVSLSLSMTVSKVVIRMNNKRTELKYDVSFWKNKNSLPFVYEKDAAQKNNSQKIDYMKNVAEDFLFGHLCSYNSNNCGCAVPIPRKPRS